MAGAEMHQYEIVGYAPRSPRDWYIHTSKGRDAAEPVAKRLMGGNPLFRGFRGAHTFSRGQRLVGVSVWGPVILVVWSGVPDTSFRWDRLQPDPRCHRFQVSVFPASDDLEVRWDGPDGELLRHVEITGGEIVTNVGDARVFDEDGETDDSLSVEWDQRLPVKVTKQLLADAADGEVKTYDGRRYVRCDRRDILKAARIVHTDPSGRTWVAIDQTGKVNTLRDPLADLRADIDPDELADQVVETWFRFSMSDTAGGPPVGRYAWPKDPDIQGLAGAIRAIQEDQDEFFALLAQASWDNVHTLVQDHYGLHYRDVNALLQEPLLNLLPHRESDQ